MNNHRSGYTLPEILTSLLLSGILILGTMRTMGTVIKLHRLFGKRLQSSYEQNVLQHLLKNRSVAGIEFSGQNKVVLSYNCLESDTIRLISSENTIVKNDKKYALPFLKLRGIKCLYGKNKILLKFEYNRDDAVYKLFAAEFTSGD